MGSDDERNRQLNTWRGNVASVVSEEVVGEIVGITGAFIEELGEKYQVLDILLTEDPGAQRDLMISAIDHSDLSRDEAEALVQREDVKELISATDALAAAVEREVNPQSAGEQALESGVSTESNETPSIQAPQPNVLADTIEYQAEDFEDNQSSLVSTDVSGRTGPETALGRVVDSAGQVAEAMEQVDPALATVIEVGMVASQGVKGAAQYVADQVLADSPIGQAMDDATNWVGEYISNAALEQTSVERGDFQQAVQNGVEMPLYLDDQELNDKGGVLIASTLLGAAGGGGVIGAIKDVGDRRAQLESGNSQRGPPEGSEVHSDLNIGMNNENYNPEGQQRISSRTGEVDNRPLADGGSVLAPEGNIGDSIGAREYVELGDLPENSQISSGDLPNTSNTTTYFRVEGGGSGTKTSQNRILVNDDGSIDFNPQCTGQLCVSVGNSDHASYYLTNNRPDGTVVVFEVDNDLHDFIMESAIPQRPVPGVVRSPEAPKVVDETKPGTALELPKVWESLLKEHSSKARVLTQQEFFEEFKK
ncbi:hypothetical protein [Marinibactrum halimedae]|uniref:hypothetical protein n=1 Tax=Marinibactrum halimedae TaxID=1444977 RepID=UPI001E57E647|nr:hypothetical protein [Marinibactrum halimedae]MCD9460997.1 hypothetical protein [Marinibactrum halimedae]